ncbi:MAG TPA: serine protease, partial [Candidatus Dormibacteraeota bacterium]
MRNRVRFLAIIALLPAALVLSAPGAGAAVPPGWASAATATIHPGTQTYTQNSQCTANFVY